MLLSDVDERRLKLANNILPEANIIAGDIREIKNDVINSIFSLVGKSDFALSVTPPCQGMSINGMKTILKYVRSGLRAEIDTRNYLILPCIEIIQKTKPAIVFFENVTEAKNTVLLINNEPVAFLDYLVGQMEGMGFTCEIEEVNFANYGVPQSRKRVFAVFSRADLKLNKVLKDKSKVFTTLRDAIGKLPALDAKEKLLSSNPEFHVLHKVPTLRPLLYKLVAVTPEGQSAFENNLCSICSYINKNENLYCTDCKSLLNKPYVIKNGAKQLIKGYSSSYRRQRWDRPANTVTTRSAFASSASNLHPTQNRVLSVYECAILQGLNPEKIDWVEKGTHKPFPDFLLRDVLGEAIPASFTELIGKRVLNQLDSNK